MKLALYADTTTQDYDLWRKRQVNSQQISPMSYTFQNPFSEEMPSELEVARHEFEREKAKLLRDISSLQEENYQLKIGVQIEESKSMKSERQELRRKVQDLENMLQSSQQQLDTLLKALEEKNDQHDRDTRTYERALQEKEMQLSFLINEIRNATIQVMQSSDEVETLSCQFPLSQRSSISEFLERVKKQGDVARKFM
ncbi:uncharacterized protein LOC108487774 [Gossypium arboreum]|uniref:uncharacterized protein LOC108487774 n=1 Tax=Gossypium arboreum TaxID=29729 RepID=UPI00081924D0|nr:uncharacterized protein LOC108487774 [Gossypium arboreum]